MNREQIVKNIKKQHIILMPDGKEYPLDLNDRKGIDKILDIAKDDNLRKYIYSEELNNMPKEAPPSIKKMQQLQLIDYEPAADSGHFRFYPKGALLYDLLCSWADDIAINKIGSMKIESPLIYDWSQDDIREQGKSFHERHYVVGVPYNPNKKWVLRFAGDFGLFKIMKDAKISYKNLPIRIYEMSKSFRYEKHGELAGLRRLRGFSMPDIHSFCLDIKQGWKEYIKLHKNYDDLAKGANVEYALVFRCVDSFYQKHKKEIVEMLKYSNKPAFIEIMDKMKHYWAVKSEFQAIDSVGGNNQLSTVQLDVVDSERYGINYVDQNKKLNGCVICHSSVGAIERRIFSILEQVLKNNRPCLPLWLSPAQVRVIPVGADNQKQAIKLCKQLNNNKIRCEIDDREISLGKKIRESEKEWLPYSIILGEKEEKSGIFSINDRLNNKKLQISKQDFIKSIKKQIYKMPYKPLWLPIELSKRPIFYG